MTEIKIKLPKELKAKFKKYLEANGMTISGFVRRCIKEALK